MATALVLPQGKWSCVCLSVCHLQRFMCFSALLKIFFENMCHHSSLFHREKTQNNTEDVLLLPAGRNCSVLQIRWLQIWDFADTTFTDILQGLMGNTCEMSYKKWKRIISSRLSGISIQRASLLKVTSTSSFGNHGRDRQDGDKLWAHSFIYYLFIYLYC